MPRSHVVCGMKVQKNDVDEELGRLQVGSVFYFCLDCEALVGDLEGQLASVWRPNRQKHELSFCLFYILYLDLYMIYVYI